MSRWITNFKNHQFQKVWEEIKIELEGFTVDDESIVTDTEELARFSKVIFYVDELLTACDPELIPPKLWDSFKSKSDSCLSQLKAYKESNNIAYLEAANQHADNLLGYVRPYVVPADKSATAAIKAFKRYSSTVSGALTEFDEKYNSLGKQLRELLDNSEAHFEKIEEILTAFKEAESKYISGTNSDDSVLEKIDQAKELIETFQEQAIELRDSLIEQYGGTGSIEYEIKDGVKTVKEETAVIKDIHEALGRELDELNKFYYKVFGDETDEGEVVGGLKQEIDTRKAELDAFKAKQEERYKALNDEIESLLPGATSAGLASAYREQKESYSDPIKNQTKLFYWSIGLIVALAFVASVDTWWPLKFEDISNVSSLLKSISFKLPIILPLIWLAGYSSKRRSEAQRLQQEYAHKEALAKSYQNFKDQIDALDDTDAHTELTQKLLESAIEAVAANASDTLDGKHGDNSPAVEALEKLTDKFDKLSEVLKNDK